MAQSTGDGPLRSFYETRIGTETNSHEALGYWTFLVGLIMGLVGVVIFTQTADATGGRVVGYGMAALAPALVMTGAVLRLPLQKSASYLVAMGMVLTVIGVAWFVMIFPAEWSVITGHTGVIVTYMGGLGLIGIAGAIVPLATDSRDVKIAALQSEAAATQASTQEDTDQEGTIADLKEDLSDSKANGTALLGKLTTLHETQAQFEQYEAESGAYRWRLRHRNGNIIAKSSTEYTQRHNAQNGIQSVRRNALGASTLIVDSENDHLSDDEENDGVVVPDDIDSKAEYEIYEDTSGEFRWRLRHDNGNIIAGCGQGYASLSGVKEAVDRIRQYVGPAEYLKPDPTAIEIYSDQSNEWRWRLIHRNGNSLASSGEGYESRAGAREAIDRLRDNIASAEIEVYEDNAGEYRWRLAGGDTRIKADSQGYESRDGAENAVERVREFFPAADLVDIGNATFEVYDDEGDQYRWRLRHRNGNILADGRAGYADRSGVWRGIESVKRNAPGAAISE